MFEIDRERERESEREINESNLLKEYLGDSNRQPQPCHENLECYPWTNPSKSRDGKGQITAAWTPVKSL